MLETAQLVQDQSMEFAHALAEYSWMDLVFHHAHLDSLESESNAEDVNHHVLSVQVQQPSVLIVLTHMPLNQALENVINHQLAIMAKLKTMENVLESVIQDSIIKMELVFSEDAQTDSRTMDLVDVFQHQFQQEDVNHQHLNLMVLALITVEMDSTPTATPEHATLAQPTAKTVLTTTTVSLVPTASPPSMENVSPNQNAQPLNSPTTESVFQSAHQEPTQAMEDV